MPTFDHDSFDAIKAWYTEWSRIPVYVATVAFAAIAFSVTDLLDKGGASNGALYLKASWWCLSASAALASAGIFLIYISFDLGVRIHLKDILQHLSMEAPRRDTRWIRWLGMGSWVCTLIAMVLLLAGSAFLILVVLSTLPA